MNIVNKKICRYCQQEKELEAFVKCPKCKDGYNYRCKECTKESKKDYYKENKDKYQKYYEETKEERLIYQKDYWNKNPEIRSKLRNDHRVAKISATIKSLLKEDHAEIREFYKIAQWMTIAFEEPFHVDHIVPLQGTNVCGLHVPWNLQVIFARDNISKSNKFEDEN